MTGAVLSNSSSSAQPTSFGSPSGFGTFAGPRSAARSRWSGIRSSTSPAPYTHGTSGVSDGSAPSSEISTRSMIGWCAHNAVFGTAPAIVHENIIGGASALGARHSPDREHTSPPHSLSLLHTP